MISTWYRASRPFTLTASVVPVVAGSSLAFKDGQANLALFFLILLASMLVQIGANLVDEYSDHLRPEGKRKLLAPYKVIALGQLSPNSVRLGAVACFCIAIVVGVYIIFVSSWIILIVCVGGLAMAYFYAAGPRPLGSLGLGEPIVFVFMGPIIVLGTYYVHTGRVSLEGTMASMAIGCLVTSILVANNIRDKDEDLMSGKTTIITKLGSKFGNWLWGTLVFASYLLILMQVLFGLSSVLLLIVLLSSATGLKAFRLISGGRDRVVQSMGLRESTVLHFRFGLLLSVGICISKYVLPA